jgi:hypothetical protein
MKTKTFKKLLEEQKQCNHPQLSQDELWILGCHKSYIQQGMKTNCPERLKYLKGWWKGCLKNYNNKNKKTN